MTADDISTLPARAIAAVPKDTSALVSVRILGPLLLLDERIGAGSTQLGGASFATANVMALRFACAAQITSRHGAAFRSAEGDLLVSAATQKLQVVAHSCGRCVTLLVPRRLLARLLPSRPGGALLPRSAALDAARLYLSDLLAVPQEAQASTSQTDIAGLSGRAALELISAALTPLRTREFLGPHREAGLLERATALIDRRPAEGWDAVALGGALGCSRSTLYRAVAPAGGVATLVAQRRLAAAHRALLDPTERRSAAAVARAHGFADASQFTRRFKRAFGLTPGEHRRGAGGPWS